MLLPDTYSVSMVECENARQFTRPGLEKSLQISGYPVRPSGSPGGIGNRLTSAEITERLHPLSLPGGRFSVRAYIFSQPNFDAIVLYVAGL